MNFNNQHSSDNIIDRELQGLRQPVESTYGLGNAIQAMQAPVKPSKLQLKWPIGIGSVAVAVTAVVIVGSASTGKAYARELHEIGKAQRDQKTMFMKSYLYQGHKDAEMVTELWLDHSREAFYQYREQGKLDYVHIADGIKKYSYNAGHPADQIGYVLASFAQIDVDKTEHRTIETVDSTLNADFFKTRKIEKQSGVTLNGRTCDYYSLAKGYYRIWVDQATKLPIQREVYDKGVTLWERDLYEYPESLPEAKFAPPTIPGVKLYDHIAERKNLLEQVDLRGQVQKVGDITISLKAVLKGIDQITAVWTTTGLDTKNGQEVSVQIEGAQNQDKFGSTLDSNLDFGDRKIQTGRLRLIWGKPFQMPTTIRIAAWTGDHGKVGPDGRPIKKLAGWATFVVNDVIDCRYAEEVLQQPMGGGVGIALTVPDKKKK